MKQCELVYVHKTKMLLVISMAMFTLVADVEPVVRNGVAETTADCGTEALGSKAVYIGPNAIMVPLGYIILVKRDAEYGAIKFMEVWHGKTEQDRYAKYISFYQDDKSGSLTKSNVKVGEGELAFPRPLGLGRLSFSFGNKEIKVGPIRLFWSGEGFVAFYGESQKQADYGIQLAPTKWTSVSQVNVFDPRVEWYRYDASRQRIIIPIDKLWGE